MGAGVMMRDGLCGAMKVDATTGRLDTPETWKERREARCREPEHVPPADAPIGYSWTCPRCGTKRTIAQKGGPIPAPPPVSK